MNSSLIARFLIYGLLAIAVGSIAWSLINSDNSSTSVPISQIAQEIEDGRVQAIQVDASGQSLTIDYKNGTRKRSLKSSASSLEEVLATYGVTGQQLNDQNVTVTYTQPSFLASIFSSSFIFLLLPILLMIGFIYFMSRQSQGAGNQAMAFGKSKAKMVTSDTPTVTFDDVAGATEAKEELQEVVHFLKEPEKYINFGARIPRGLLMVGPPGTGKTLIAKAVAGEADVFSRATRDRIALNVPLFISTMPFFHDDLDGREVVATSWDFKNSVKNGLENSGSELKEVGELW